MLLAATLVVLEVIVSSHLAHHRARVPQQDIGQDAEDSHGELKQATRKPADFDIIRTLKWLVDGSGSRPKNEAAMKVYPDDP